MRILQRVLRASDGAGRALFFERTGRVILKQFSLLSASSPRKGETEENGISNSMKIFHFCSSLKDCPKKVLTKGKKPDKFYKFLRFNGFFLEDGA
jgi:hypothetical protein